MTEETTLSSNKILCACGCGELIPTINSNGKPAKFKQHHNLKIQKTNPTWKGHKEAHKNAPLKICECGRCDELIPSINKRGRPLRFKQGHHFNLRGENHYHWRGGVVIHNGYRLVWNPKHHRANPQGYVREHVVIMEQKLGRHLLPNEDVHHINGNKLDNRPENLTNLMHDEHAAYHFHLSRQTHPV